MSGSTPYSTVLVGNGTYEDGVCTGNILCNGTPNVQCSRMNGTTGLAIRGMVTAPSCNWLSSGTLTFYESTNGGVSWSALASTSRPSGYGYSWAGWGVNTGSNAKIWKLNDSTYGDSQWVYVNYCLLTVNVKDLLGNTITDSHVYVDGVLIGPGGSSILVTSGNHVVHATRDVTCSGYPFDTWADVECSHTVNVIEDMSYDVEICMTNECREYNWTLYNDAYFWFITCDGTSGGSQPWKAAGGIYPCGMRVTIIEDNDHADLCAKMPWDDCTNECCDTGIPCCKSIDAYPNTEYTWTNATHTYKIVTGQLWSHGATRWLKIKRVCWPTRPNFGTVGTIDRSIVYVDCANGNDNNSGLCSFSNAVKTITKAQSIVENNGTIYVKYGNCLYESLDAVLNPIQSTVHISPRQDDSTEGTGSVVIDGT